MSHYKPYPSYKDSGVEWIGKVPKHWDTARIARLGRLSKANGGSKLDNVEAGVPCIRYGDLYTSHEHVIRASDSYIGRNKLGDYTQIQYGDALFAASGETFEDIGRSSVNLIQEEAYCGGDIIVLRPSTNLDPLFLGYALDSMPSKAQKTLMGKGYTVVHIYGDQLRDLVIAYPPHSEQKAIATAVDRETVRIDSLIAKKTTFIELLTKKRQALITHAVTKGLNPKAKMKDSGVGWIGEVPAHWLVGRLRDFCRSISTGPFGTTLSVGDYIEDGVPVINPSHMSDGICLPDRTVTVSKEKAQHLAYWALCEGDLVAARRGELGRAAVVTSKEAGWICGTGSLRLTPLHNKALATYLYSVLQSSYARAWLDRESVGSTMPNLNEALTGRLPVVIPPSIVEQARLLSQLDELRNCVNALIVKTQDSIDLLKKRRSAFITAAVTGQIDLRESV